MRFFAANPQPSNQPPMAGQGVAADSEFGDVPRTLASIATAVIQPWPADAPPDDLDERVRKAGEWGAW